MEHNNFEYFKEVVEKLRKYNRYFTKDTTVLFHPHGDVSRETFTILLGDTMICKMLKIHFGGYVYEKQLEHKISFPGVDIYLNITPEIDNSDEILNLNKVLLFLEGKLLRFTSKTPDKIVKETEGKIEEVKKELALIS